MNFDFHDVDHVLFGVCTKQRREISAYTVQVDREAQQLLYEMAEHTWDLMLDISDDGEWYEPTERYSGNQHLAVLLNDPAAEFFRDIHETVNFEPGGNILRNPRTVFCYFLRMYDASGNQLTALRRSTTFKGILRSRLLGFRNDSLYVAEDQMFRLDYDFDLLVIDEEVRILNVAGFETMGSLREVIREAAEANVQNLHHALPFLDFNLGEHGHAITLTIARQLASIKNQQLDGITQQSLQSECSERDIPFNITANGLIRFSDDDIPDLLDLLDRRRFADQLIPGHAVQYKAGSRQRIR